MELRITLTLVQLLVGVVLILVLALHPGRKVLFGVAVTGEVSRSASARSAVSSFRTAMAVVIALSIAAFWIVPDSLLAITAALVPLVTLAVAMMLFHQRYRRFERHAIQMAAPEGPLTVDRDPLPWYTWLGVVPFLLLGGAALLLNARWEDIPDRFPIHWGVNGPDRWADRSVRAVFGPLVFGAVLAGWMLIMGIAGWIWSRRTPLRPAMLGSMLCVEALIACLFGVVALNPVYQWPIWAIVILPLALIIPMIAYLVSKSSEASDAPLTPQEAWKCGMFYYNPSDAALFVEKRMGVGYTLNFAHPLSWWLLGGLAGIVIVLPLMIL